MRNPKAVLVTFGDGDLRYRRAASRLIREAKDLEIYTATLQFNLKSLQAIDMELYKFARTWISSGNLRGYGYWIWKSAIIGWVGREFSGHLVHYMDAGHIIKPGLNSRQRFLHWFDEARSAGSLSWSIPGYKERFWTKRETYNLMRPKHVDWNSDQIEASSFFLPSKMAEKYSEVFRGIVTLESGFHLTDELRVDQYQDFIKHRHDQSIHSLLWKEMNWHYRPTETFPLRDDTAAFAARYASGFPWDKKAYVVPKRFEFWLGKAHKAALMWAGNIRYRK